MHLILRFLRLLYRLGVFAKYILTDLMSGRMIVPSCNFLFFANGMHFNEKSEAGLNLGKAEIWLSLLERNGIKGHLVLNPLAVRPIQPSARSLTTLEIMAVCSVLKLLFSKDRKWFIEQCDPDQKLKRSLFNKVAIQTYNNFLEAYPTPLILGIGLTPGLCLVAKYRGITTVEIQHGSYNKMELTQIGLSSDSPDLAFVWDRFFQEDMANAENLIVIGYPKDFNGTYFRDLKQGFNSSNRVLVSLSYDDLNSIDPAGVINVELFNAVLQLLNLGYKITFKPHPAALAGLEISLHDRKYHRKFKPWFKLNPHMQTITLNEESSVFELLINHDFHLTYSSSTVLEAAYLGIPSFLLCKSFEVDDFLNRLIEDGYAYLTSPSTLGKDLTTPITPRQYPNPLDEGIFLESIKAVLKSK